MEKKFFALRPTYAVYNQRNELVLKVRKKLNLVHPHFVIESELDEIRFHTIGDYFGEKFSISSENEKDIVAHITRENGYTIDIIDESHDATALIAVVIIIHLCCHLTKDE